nr:hypothetical protein [Schaalia sp. Marseille-Q2122]
MQHEALAGTIDARVDANVVIVVSALVTEANDVTWAQAITVNVIA